MKSEHRSFASRLAGAGDHIHVRSVVRDPIFNILVIMNSGAHASC